MTVVKISAESSRSSTLAAFCSNVLQPQPMLRSVVVQVIFYLLDRACAFQACPRWAPVG